MSDLDIDVVHIEIVRLLLEKGTNTEAQTKVSSSVLEIYMIYAEVFMFDHSIRLLFVSMDSLLFNWRI